MPASRGTPLEGDRAAFDSVNHPAKHALDIKLAALLRHLPLPGAAGNYARSNGTNWVVQLGLLIADLTGYVRGSIIRGGATAWEALAIGVAGKVLKSDGTDAAWGSVAHAELTGIGASDHHAPVTLGAGNDAALSLAGQVLTLADVLTPGEHTAIGDGAPHHVRYSDGEAQAVADAQIATHALVAGAHHAAFILSDHTAIGDAAPHHAAVTLDANAGAILGLTGQQVNLDTQAANLVFVGPAAGAAAVPTFRAMVAADLPSGGWGSGTAGQVAQWAAGGATLEDSPVAYDSTKQRLVLQHEGHNVPVPVDGRNAAHNYVEQVLYGVMTEVLTWAGVQTLQAGFIAQAASQIAGTTVAALLSLNQSGTGDILALQDGGVTAVRFPDQGGAVLVPQAGGFQALTGLLGYDSVKKRLVLQSESHNYPVPIDPRNHSLNYVTVVDYTP